MRFASLSNPTYSTPRMAGLQAQASTANVAQAQKAEAFTPSGRIQRQGFKNEAQVKLAIKAIETHLKELTEESELWDRVKEVFRGVLGKIHPQAFKTHKEDLEEQLGILNSQLISGNYTGEGAYLVGLDLQGADLQGAKLRFAKLHGAQLQKADLLGADLLWAKLQGADLLGANLRGAKLQGTELQWANLQGTDLQGAELQWAKLQGAKLQLAGLIGADLRWAQLQWADLRWAYLEEADLQWADLRWAKLQLASLMGAKLQNADLRWAKLIGAYLQKANLRGANLDGADLFGADLDGAILEDAFGVPKNINPTMWPELKGTILEYCINQHKLSEKDSTDDRINGLLLQIRSREQDRQAKVKELLASLQN